MSQYPKLVINLSKLENNISQIKKRCDKQSVLLAGVIKGCTGFVEVAKEFAKQDVPFIASSRLEQLQKVKDSGISTPLMMIRVPSITEVDDVIDICEVSLNSEIKILEKLNESAKNKNKNHKVILMKDLGDLREGFYQEDEIIEAAKLVENMSNLHLLGIGTNLGCYGAIAATVTKMKELIDVAEKIEKEIGRKLEIISGGATTTLPRIIEENLPERINLLRVGEGILLAKDLKDLWGYDQSYMYQDVFKLQCEVIEVKNKPSHPVGEIMFDAFGNKPTYEDKGIRKRALLGIGKVDYAFYQDLIMNEDGCSIVGASSDHTIVDIEDAKRDIKVGDILEFNLSYSNLVYVTNSDNIKKEFIR